MLLLDRQKKPMKQRKRMKVGNLVKHRSTPGLGTVVDNDGLRHNLKVVIVLWCDQRGRKYAPVNELEIISESR